VARNSGGTYSLPAGNPVVTGTTISSTTHNSTLNDIATELTDSLSRSGKGPMTAPLELADGSAAAPALSFDNDTDCGWYRIGANNLGLALNGAKVVDVGTAATAVTGTLSSSGKLSSSAADGEVPANKDWTYASAVTRYAMATAMDMLGVQVLPADWRLIEATGNLPVWSHVTTSICSLYGTVKVPSGATVTALKIFAVNTDGTNRSLTISVNRHATDLSSSTTGFTTTSMANAVAVSLVTGTQAWRDVTITPGAVGTEGQVSFQIDVPTTTSPDTIQIHALRFEYTQTAVKPSL
jgi:hypothetical protein